MNEPYLWDRSGPPDPEVARLEALLSSLGHKAPVPRRPSQSWWYALAACVVLAAGIGLWMRPGPASVWRMNGKPVTIGKSIDSGSGRVLLESLAVGEVQLEPNTELRVISSDKGGTQQLALLRGTLHALIWAPPKQFVVSTPQGKSIDLGCAYTISILPDQTELLTVTSGWVAFQAGDRESFLPSGASCRIRPKSGLGLPYVESAGKDLQEAVASYDARPEAATVARLLDLARTEDSLTLWHLLLRTRDAERERVARRFGEFHPQADREGLAKAEAGALDAAWNLLGYGDTGWWRSWKHTWRGL